MAGLLALGLAKEVRPQERSIDLKEALRLSDAAPAARIVALEVERARALVRGAGLWPNPSLNYSHESTGPLGVDEFITASLPFPLTGRLSLEKDAARSESRAAEFRALQDRVELHARIREAFVDLLSAQLRTSALEEGVARLDELVRVLSAREKEGESSGFDRMRAERERAEVGADLSEARAQLGRARSVLAGALAIDSQTLKAEGALEAPAPLPTMEEVRAQALERGDVHALRADAEGARLSSRAASRRIIPEPTLNAGTKATRVPDSTSRGAVLGVSISLPLFDRGQGAEAVARVEASLFEARGRQLARESQAEGEAALLEARARREAENSYAPASNPEGLVRIAQKAYEEGEMKILELLDAYRTALNARLRILDLRSGARKADIAVDRATGVERIF